MVCKGDDGLEVKVGNRLNIVGARLVGDRLVVTTDGLDDTTESGFIDGITDCGADVKLGCTVDGAIEKIG